jgi:hypothetical protein
MAAMVFVMSGCMMSSSLRIRLCPYDERDTPGWTVREGKTGPGASRRGAADGLNPVSTYGFIMLA